MDTDSKYSTDRLTVKIAGWLALISHLSYYYTWIYLIPQPFDSFWLRLSSSLVSVPLIVIDYWPEKLKRWLPVYWHLFLMYVLTITCTYLTLQNNFSTMWVITEVMAIFVLSILINSIMLLFLNLLIGILAAYIMYLANPFTAIIWSDMDKASIALIPIIVATSVLPNFAKKLASQEKNNALQALAGSIAHEMRNPLAQIQGSLELIQMQSPDLNKNQYLRNAYKVIQNGLQVIDLTMDAIAEKPIDTTSFKLLSALDLARESVADFAYREAEHANRVSVTGGDFKFMGDPVMVKYVLYNLITNALYYVKVLPDAEIIISVMPDTNGVNQIQVRDTGPGIAPDAIPKLFDSFYTSDKQGGTGLGLSYCKRTMTALGGDIHCESELGKYTAFTLSFPKVSEDQVSTEKVSNMDKLPITKSEYLAGKTLLIAEDDRISRMIVKSILDRQGIQCLEAENGQEALNLLAEYHCDLMLTDMQMPIMNGLKLIETIRQRETIASGNPLPIIALTSQEGDILNTAIKLGINDYLIKPVSVEGLVPKLQQLLAS